MKILIGNKSATQVLTVGLCLLHHLSFSVAADDDLSLFYDNEPLQSSSTLDLTNSDDSLISDANLNGEANPDQLFSVPPDDSGSLDLLFADDVSPISLDDPILLAGCGSIDSGALRKSKKARIRRDTTCTNPYSSSNPNLSLPTLEQNDEQHPRRPQTDAEKKGADALSISTFQLGIWTRVGGWHFARCSYPEEKYCSTGDPKDVQFDSDLQHYVLTGFTTSKRFPPPLRPSLESC